MADIGRPKTTDEQFQKFLDDMAPFLKLGESLNHAIEDAGCEKHAFIIYEKYRQNDWFSQKVDAYRSYPGKLVNNILTKQMLNVNERMAQGLPLSEEDWRNVRFMAEKHRTTQTFFVTRTETAQVDPSKVGKILDTMETDYESIGSEATKQMVETESPIQDQG
jgi:hypothetical protein